MSAMGHKQTLEQASERSALPLNSGHDPSDDECPLSAISGHSRSALPESRSKKMAYPILVANGGCPPAIPPPNCLVRVTAVVAHAAFAEREFVLRIHKCCRYLRILSVYAACP